MHVPTINYIFKNKNKIEILTFALTGRLEHTGSRACANNKFPIVIPADRHALSAH